MHQVQIKLKLCDLLQPLTFKSFDLAYNLQNFIQALDHKQSSFLKRPLNQQKLYINTAIKTLVKPLTLNLQKIWVKLLLIDTLFSTCQCNLLTFQLVQFLTQLSSELNVKLNNIKCQKPSNDKSLTNKLSSGIFKIKSMMNLPSSLSRSQLVKTNVSQSSINDKQINFQALKIKLLDSILSYQRKKLQSFDFLLKIRQKLQKSEPIFKQTQDFQSLQQDVWKIINLIQPHATIVKTYKKIAFMSQQIKPFMTATFVRLCKDSLMLYPYIVKLIEIGTQNIKQKYDKIISQKLPKQIKQVRLQNLSKDMIFIEVDNLIQQLTSINETIFYLFCGKQHFMYLDLQIPPNFFLNTTNNKLDDIYTILKEVHEAAQKHQRSKLYISQMAQKLDESVSKVVEKGRQMKSLSNLIRLQKCQEEKNPQNQQKKQNFILTRTKKKPSFFEEITQEV